MIKPRTKKILLTVAAALGALAVLAGVFFAGFFTRGALGGSTYDWVLNIIKENYYLDVDIENADEVAADALVEQYLDIYSAYYTPEEYAALQSSNAGNKSGFGISATFIPGTGLVVAEAVGNSPAFAAGLRSGDVIISCGKGGQQYTFSSLSDFSAFADSVGEGEEVVFNCASGKSCTVQKAAYTESYVFLATNESAWTFTGDDALDITETSEDRIDYLPDGAAYISLSQFYGDAPAQFCSAVEKFNEEGCTSLILDLRSDGGGFVKVMQGIAACFEGCDGGSVAMEARYKNGKREVYRIDAASPQPTVSKDADVYVLANSNTASASEALIGCLVSYGVLEYGDIYISEYTRDYLDAVGLTAEQLKSGKTYGKGIMQSTFLNPVTGEALKLTTAQIYWPDGTTIHGRGLSSADGCKAVPSPMPLRGDGKELETAVGMIYGAAA